MSDINLELILLERDNLLSICAILDSERDSDRLRSENCYIEFLKMLEAKLSVIIFIPKTDTANSTVISTTVRTMAREPQIINSNFFQKMQQYPGSF